MELIDFSKNSDSINKQNDIKSVLLYGAPDSIVEAKITVCIPTYKRPLLLREAIESAVNQSTQYPFRIIIVDNDDDFDNKENLDFVKALNKKNITYYKNSITLGPIGNLNRCALLPNTEWVSFLHDDDLLKTNYIEKISQILIKYGKKIDGLSNSFDDPGRPNIGKFPLDNTLLLIVNAAYKFFKDHTKKMIRIPIWANLFGGNIYGAPSCGVVFKRISFIDSGGFDKNDASNDWVFNIKFSNRFKYYKYRESLAIYRWLDNYSLTQKAHSEFNRDRKTIFLSLKRNYLSCKVMFFLLGKSFNAIMDSDIEEPLYRLRLYHNIRRIIQGFFL
jgi:glycosyltransferase involved in cell wall biosynthesis